MDKIKIDKINEKNAKRLKLIPEERQQIIKKMLEKNRKNKINS